MKLHGLVTLLRNNAEAGDTHPTERTHTLEHKLLTEVCLSRSQDTFRKKSNDAGFSNAEVAVEFPSGETNLSTYTNERSKEERDEHSTHVIKIGVLSKTTVSCSGKEGSKRGQTRQRHFRLTEEALEYLHQFSQVNHTP